MDREEAEVPDAVGLRLQPDGSEKWAVGGVAVEQQVGVGFGGEVFAELRFVEAAALDDAGFDIPAGGCPGPAIGEVGQRDDGGVVRFNGWSEVHRVILRRAGFGLYVRWPTDSQVSFAGRPVEAYHKE